MRTSLTSMAGFVAGLAVAGGALAGCAASPDPGGGGGGDDGDDDGPGGPDGGGGGGGGADAGSGPVMGCTGDGPAAQPFGNHAHPYAAGSILPDHRAPAELDDAVRLFYSTWKSRYLDPSCGGGRYYVKTGDGRQTVSEASGYGMMIVAYMAGHDAQAREIFDGLYRYVDAHPSAGSPDLMAWQQNDACGGNPAANSAADADLDVAYALLLADKQWGSSGAIDYRAEAVRLIQAIRWAEVDAGASYIRLGDWTNPGDAYRYDATRSSDFMPGHFASFEAAIGDGTWSHLTVSSYAMVSSLQANHAAATGLLPDFVVHPTSSPAPAPGNFLERPVDGAYSFNACRVPWRLAVHFLTAGDARARTATQKINQWIRGKTGGNPAQIKAGYGLDGNPHVDFRSHAFVGPFGVGAMVDAANQSWLNSVWDTLESGGPEGYYADTLKLLSMIVMSGNWWAPEAAPCAS